MITANTLGECIVFFEYQNVFHICIFFSAKNDLKGLTSTPENSFLVTFHCIVPKLHWQWDESSCIHMRFEGDALGNWKHNVGDFKKAGCVNMLLCIYVLLNM